MPGLIRLQQGRSRLMAAALLAIWTYRGEKPCRRAALTASAKRSSCMLCVGFTVAVQFIGRGKVRKHPFQFDVPEPSQFPEKLLGLVVPDAEPPHAGVDLQVEQRLAEQLAGRGIQGPNLLKVEYRRGEVEADTLPLLARIDPPQNQHRPVDAAFAELNPLGEEGHAEGGHPELLQFRGDVHEAVAVGVRLDHCQDAASLGDGGPDAVEVGAKRPEVDHRDGGTAVEHDLALLYTGTIPAERYHDVPAL